MKIVWDELKRIQNRDKHGMDFANLTLEFFLSARIVIAKEGRFAAIGQLHGHSIVAVVFRPLGTEAIAVVSMRPASKKERRQ